VIGMSWSRAVVRCAGITVLGVLCVAGELGGHDERILGSRVAMATDGLIRKRGERG